MLTWGITGRQAGRQTLCGHSIRISHIRVRAKEYDEERYSTVVTATAPFPLDAVGMTGAVTCVFFFFIKFNGNIQFNSFYICLEQ